MELTSLSKPSKSWSDRKLVDVEFILFMEGNVVMEQSFGAPKVTEDGVNTAESIEFKDKVKKVSFRLVVHVANAPNDVAQYQIAGFCGC